MESAIRQVIEIIRQLVGVASLVFARRDRKFARNTIVRLTLDILESINQSLISYRDLHDPTFHPPETPVRLEWAGSEYTSGVRDQLAGLHQLLNRSVSRRYSILVPLVGSGSLPDRAAVEQTLRSALFQTAPDYEVLVGVGGEVDRGISDLLAEHCANSAGGHRLRIIACEHVSTRGSIPSILNQLAEHATGDFLLLLEPGELIRPDLLYRYEQTLRLISRPDDMILYCNDLAIDAEEAIVPGRQSCQPLQLHFPYVFASPSCRGILIPTGRWRSVGGFGPEATGDGRLDLFLRLDLAGARFCNVPLFLLATRVSRENRPGGERDLVVSEDSSLAALAEYYRQKGLDWECAKGYAAGSFRAIPPAREGLRVHVVVPFHNQKELTLQAISSIRRQRNVAPLITAVDNRSTDASIATELRAMGVEVLKIDEPFNFSRLCNAGARQSRFASESDLLLFLNNDVELDEGALEEMGRWIYQDKIGIVGARLHFPDRTIQHAGVEIVTTGSHLDGMLWRHIDYKRQFRDSDRARYLGLCDAITGACLMIQRTIFEKVGGFDEVWYPVALSDTDLAVRVKKLGLHCFYTPFAFGTHYENASRRVGTWEDFEFSHWLYQNARRRGSDKSDLLHPVFGQIDRPSQ